MRANCSLEDALRPSGTFADFRKMLDKYAKHDAIMVVGHNPSLSEFLGRSISENGCEAAIELKKGRGSAGRNRTAMPRSLIWCLTPKILRSLYAAARKLRPKTSRK